MPNSSVKFFKVWKCAIWFWDQHRSSKRHAKTDQIIQMVSRELFPLLMVSGDSVCKSRLDVHMVAHVNKTSRPWAASLMIRCTRAWSVGTLECQKIMEAIFIIEQRRH